MTDLTIGRVARTAAVGVETIRFYERRGLIEQPPKPNGSGPRLYSGAVVARVRFIRQAQQLGFSLREIRELLALRADRRTDCSKVRKQAQAKLADVEERIGRLQQIAGALQTLIARCPGRGRLQTCSIMDALELRSGNHALSDAPAAAGPSMRRGRSAQ
ncbi:MAG: MerR family DNA-binding protein [Sphingomonadales bacterium]|nr:MerR family DNA-binding protein [Sphingomonadales bacterium]